MVDEADENAAVTKRQRIFPTACCEQLCIHRVVDRFPGARWPAQSERRNDDPALLRAWAATSHELLRTIAQDAMYDFQRETKADMMGLHIDLLRMGRGWKTKLRTLINEHAVGGLRDLPEENQRLRLGE